MPEILSALRHFLSVNGGVDFILHGGDMIDSTTEDHIETAAAFFDFGVPVYLCLGNHDLTRPDAVDMWMTRAPRFFKGAAPDYTVVSEGVVIHVAPNHWGEIPFYWGSEQNPHLSTTQMEHLSRGLRMKTDRPHMILTHSPVCGSSEDPSCFPGSHPSPHAAFTEQFTSLIEKHANIQCVLGAHNHLNTRMDPGGVDFITVSSLMETPFEVKMFEISPSLFSPDAAKSRN